MVSETSENERVRRGEGTHADDLLGARLGRKHGQDAGAAADVEDDLVPAGKSRSQHEVGEEGA